MSLDIKKYLDRPFVPNEDYYPGKNNLRIFDHAYRYEQGFLLELRFFPKEVFSKYVLRVNWTQEKLDQLVEKGKLIPAMIDIRKGNGCYIDSGFIFSTKAKQEYQEFLEEVNQDYDFSELI